MYKGTLCQLLKYLPEFCSTVSLSANFFFDGHKIPPNTRKDSFSDASSTCNGSIEDWRRFVVVKQADFHFLSNLNHFILSSLSPKVWQGGDPLMQKCYPNLVNPVIIFITRGGCNIIIIATPLSSTCLIAYTQVSYILRAVLEQAPNKGWCRWDLFRCNYVSNISLYHQLLHLQQREDTIMAYWY